MVADEALLHAAEFETRRRRVLAAAVRLFGGFVLGVAVYVALCETLPGVRESEAATAVLVVGIVLLMLDYWRTLRASWRCPACEVRWAADELLASGVWNHCEHCGATLRIAQQQDPISPQHVEQDKRTLAERYAARRRTASFAAVGVSVAGLAVFAWVHAQAFGELVEQVALMTVIATAVGFAVHGLRCPRCEKGMVRGRGHHCPRCGWGLPTDPRGEEVSA